MKKGRWGELLVFLLALLFFSAGLESKSIWYDETLSLIISSAPLGKLFFFLKYFSPHPPAYFLFLKPLTHIDSLFLWRFLSAIFASLGAVAIYNFFSKKSFSLAISLTLLFILAPISLYYAQEIRMYAMMEGLSALLFVLLFDCYENYTAAKCYALYLVSVIFALTHYLSMLILAGLLGGILLAYFYEEEKKRITRLFFPVVTGFILIFLWFLNARHALRAAQSGGRVWHLGFKYYFSMLSKFYHLPFYAGMVVVTIIIVLAIYKIVKRNSSWFSEITALFVIFSPFILLQMHPPHHWLNPRYFIALLPLYLIESGNLIIFLGEVLRKKKVIIYATSLLILIFFSAYAISYDVYYFKTDKHAWKALIKDFVISDMNTSVFLFDPPYMMVSFTFNLPTPLGEKLEIFHVPNRIVSWRRIDLKSPQKSIFIAHPSFVLQRKVFSELKSRGYRIYLVTSKKEKGYIPEEIYRVIEGKLYVYRLAP